MLQALQTCTFSGRVINITSVHGRITLPRISNYTEAKHAVETWSDSLRLEMNKFGVQVTIVEPGMFAAGTSIFSETMVSVSVHSFS